MTPYQSNPNSHRRTAHAPYNFVSLPEDVVSARKPIPHDSFKNGLSGRIHCTLTTKSPTYIRGMLTYNDYKSLKNKDIKDYTEEDYQKIAPFFSTKLDADGNPLPLIPGSSLRGMLRSLVEIISYGRIRWVSGKDTYFYRAMAASRDDPLKKPYTDVMGKFGSNVRSGFIRKDGDKWYIQAAPIPDQRSFCREKYFFEVEDSKISMAMFPRFTHISRESYYNDRSSLYFAPVKFNAAKTSSVVNNRTIWKNKVTAIAPRGSAGNFNYKGYLVCSGNMRNKNTPAAGKPGDRKHHTVFLDINDPDDRKTWIEIDGFAVSEYLDNLSEFQKEQLGSNGCLIDGRPVFFIHPKVENGKIFYFGHSPNFRIPYRIPDHRHTSNIRDFIPAHALGTEQPDLADVIFGWTEDTDEKIGPKDQRKGCVKIEDAHFTSHHGNGIWHQNNPNTPRILSGPKSSTFQHYLVQDKDFDHNPDDKSTTAHYGTEPSKTQIRGFKRYWPQGENPSSFVNENHPEEKKELDKHKSQYTRVSAINKDVTFEFDIHFNFLHPEELGALCWALSLPGNSDKPYCHRIGMGKPLGMGVVEIESTLFKIDQNKRYQNLFTIDDPSNNERSWETGEEEIDKKSYIKAFERFILDRIDPEAKQLIDQYRIQELLAMHIFNPKTTNLWLNKTRYMELEEFKERPVLSDPISMIGNNSNHQRDQFIPITSYNGPKIIERIQVGDRFIGAVVFYNDTGKDRPGTYLTVQKYTDREDYVFFIPKAKNQEVFPEEKTILDVEVVSIEESKYHDIFVVCKIYPKN